VFALATVSAGIEIELETAVATVMADDKLAVGVEAVEEPENWLPALDADLLQADTNTIPTISSRVCVPSRCARIEIPRRLFMVSASISVERIAEYPMRRIERTKSY
jgi:hypothetical protein